LPFFTTNKNVEQAAPAIAAL